jgi:autophagy-related protein 2
LILRDISLTSSEVRIRDGVVGSVYQSVVCPKIFEDDSSPGDFFHVHLWSTGEDDSLITKGEVSIQPLSVSIDQDTMDFMQRFVRETTVAGVAEEELDERDEEETLSSEEPIIPPTKSSTPLFQSLAISSISLEINYRSKRLSLSRLRQGDVLQFLNLVPMIEGVRLCLREVRLVDVVDGSDVGKRLAEIWAQDTKKTKLMKSISHVTPVRSFTNLSSGVKELINQPRKQMIRKDGNVGRGVLRGVSMFVKTLTIESLNLIDSVVSSAQGALEFAGGSPPTRIRSIENDVEDEDEILEWTSVEKGARERELDPSSAIEGLYSGGDALVRGVRTTIRGDSGVSGFILRPAISATQAVSVVLRGARSTLDSGKHRAETERKYKAPYTREEMMGN